MYGVLVVDKPSGWTSHDVCNFVKRRFKIKKVGHTGTLDPQATGVLVLLLGRYTKLASKFSCHSKDYTGVVELGKRTSTQDAEGDVLEEFDVNGLPEDNVRDVVNSFLGKQKQLPPMVSAIKSGGVRLYKLARKGKVIERELRDVEIFDIVCNKIELPLIDIFVSVSKGTYVRTIANDIGEKLGVGGFLKSLRRVRSGDYTCDDCVGIDMLKKLEDQNDLMKFIKKTFD